MWLKFFLILLLAGIEPVIAEPISIESKQVKREQLFGALIGKGSDYLVYSDTAKFINGKTVCTIGTGVADRTKIELDYKEHRKAVRIAHEAKERPLFMARMEASDKLHTQRHTSTELKNLLAKISQLGDEINVINSHLSQQYKELEEKHKANIAALGPTQISFYVIHSPTDPSKTILPFIADLPSASFEKQFLSAISTFMSTCQQISPATSYHYYKDTFRWSNNDKPIASFSYEVKNDALRLWRVRTDMYRAIAKTQGKSTYPSENPDLTLAGFIANNKRQAHLAAVYRNNFEYAEGRQKGIVYKLEPYWQQYDEFDIPRRIFDGDFKGLTDKPEFKAYFTAFADNFSKQCQAHVAQWTIFEKKEELYESSSWNLDGSRTIHSKEYKKTTQVDQRFMPQWSQYNIDVNKAILNSGFFSGFSLVLGIRGQINQYLKQNGCDSATTTQMIENFIRAAKKRPSIQENGIFLKGSSAESDPPTKQGKPPENEYALPIYKQSKTSVKPLLDKEEIERRNQAAIAAFGGGGLYGGDWKTPTMTEQKYSDEVDSVTGKEHDEFKAAVEQANKALDKLTKAQAKMEADTLASNQKIMDQLMGLIEKRNATEKGSAEYKQLQDTIDFTMMHLGITEEPKLKNTEERSPSVTPQLKKQLITTEESVIKQQDIAEIRQYNKTIDDEVAQIIQERLNLQQQAFSETVKRFQPQLVAAKTNEERSTLQNALKEQLALQNEQFQQWVRETKEDAEANKK